ncbi:tRNA (guanine(6)-N2)-methyltransferase [Archaeoglobus neptunius]|uniref:tRNA (guanine(6)-N2)-methyltransferase n=1 Tax=Archaeoglobus neptunius TaxID=2798580 RepID=UPI00192956B5
MKFYATLAPGLEDVAAEEVRRLGGDVTEIRVGKGRLFFEGSRKLIDRINRYSRTLERLNVLLYRGTFSGLDDIYSAVKNLEFDFLNGKSFAIRSMRSGTHNFTSIDVARVAGQAVIDSFQESYGKRLKVNLNNPDVIIRAEVVENEFFVGIDTTGDDALHRRWWRVYNHPAHLNATIACSMLKIAGWNPKKSLIDPMCGSGTIPIEAALMGRNVPNKRSFAYENLCQITKNDSEKISSIRMELYGTEKFRKHLEGATLNAESAGVADTITFSLGDATELSGSYDIIATNPPYGLRIWKKSAIRLLYEKFAIAAKKCMNDRLVLITAEYRIFEECAERVGLELIHDRFVKYGGLLTKILLYSLS